MVVSINMETVELSIGTVKIKPLTNKIYNRALGYSTVVEKGVSNARFFNYCEHKMTQIRFWKWGSLTIKDGTILRNKIISMLTEDGIVSQEKNIQKENISEDANLFEKLNPHDQQWFNSVGQKQKNMLGGK